MSRKKKRKDKKIQKQKSQSLSKQHENPEIPDIPVPIDEEISLKINEENVSFEDTIAEPINPKPKRIPISKQLRFEVFKRDKFTCQYCGRSAPDVILNVDHIKPVVEGGTNEILNLLTSCFDCNNGKRAKLLSDDNIIKKQQLQLEALQERKEQIEVMFEWKKGYLK